MIEVNLVDFAFQSFAKKIFVLHGSGWSTNDIPFKLNASKELLV